MTEGIAGSCRTARRRRISGSVDGYRIGIDVIWYPGAALVDLNDSGAQSISRDLLGNDLTLREVEAFIAEEEVGFSAPEPRQHRASHGAAIAVVVSNRDGRVSQVSAGRVIVIPSVCAADVGGMVVPVRRTMKVVGAALGDHLDLRAARAIEIGCLPRRVYLELFHRVRGCWQDSARRRATRPQTSYVRSYRCSLACCHPCRSSCCRHPIGTCSGRTWRRPLRRRE